MYVNVCRIVSRLNNINIYKYLKNEPHNNRHADGANLQHKTHVIILYVFFAF